MVANAKKTTTKIAKKKTTKGSAAKSKKMVSKVAGKADVKMKVTKTAAVSKSKTAKKLKPITENQSRIEIIKLIAERCNLSKSDVENVFRENAVIMAAHLNKKGSGVYTIPMSGIKIARVLKPKTNKRTMVSPLTGKEVIIKAKPARLGVKVKALKSLKEMVEK